MLTDVCVYCVALGVPYFLFGLKELREKYLTGEYRCHPVVWITYLGIGKNIKKGREECNAGEEEVGESTWEVMKELAWSGSLLVPRRCGYVRRTATEVTLAEDLTRTLPPPKIIWRYDNSKVKV